jgi:predicted transcriptional regulator of viral defense system
MSSSVTKVPHPAPLGLSAQERAIIDVFVASEKSTVGVADVLAVRPVTVPHAAQILARLARKGWLVRVGRGAYSVVPLGSPGAAASSADAWALAMALFAPCYISGWTAAEHWDLTEQIFNAISVVTSRPQRHRERIVAGIRFVFRTADQSTFFGITRVWNGSQRVDVADPHRLVIDILAAPDFGGGARHTLDVLRHYFRSKHADPDKLIVYAQRFGKGVVFKRLGYCAETFGAPSTDWLELCKAGMSQGISQLDPNGPKQGRVVSRWRLRINIPVDET